MQCLQAQHATYCCRRQKDTVRTGQTVYTNICQDVPYPLSFELRVLEALLSETARSFASKTQRLRYICERIVADIDQDVADLHRLVPIQRWVSLSERMHFGPLNSTVL